MQQEFSSCSSEAEKPKMKSGEHSFSQEGSCPGLQLVTFFLCPPLLEAEL